MSLTRITKADIVHEIAPPDQTVNWFDEVTERARDATAGSLERRRPLICAQILELLAANASVKSIERATGVDHKTIQKLKWKHRETLESRRKEFSKTYAMAAAEITDLVFKKIANLEDDEEALNQTSLKDLALGAAIYTDKAMQLSGMATVTIEHRKGPSIEDAQAAIMAARSKIAENAKLKAIDV